MRKVRWGRVAEIDRRIKVGSKAFNQQPTRLKHLMSWRAMHLVRNHKAIRAFARRRGVKPSSDLKLRQKVLYVTERI